MKSIPLIDNREIPLKNISDKYIGHEYLNNNPTWDIEDSPWKARHVYNILTNNSVNIDSICEVGCGAGGVLHALRNYYSNTDLYGYDIAPDAVGFWAEHCKDKINFQLGDFFCLNIKHYDAILLLDVIEHLNDPYSFLCRLSSYSKYFVFHIPLDLSAINVLRETPLLNVRKKVGHIHYFTKNLALSLLDECGYEIIDWQYSGAFSAGPKQSFKTRIALLPRIITYAINKNFGVKLIGGETLFVLAKCK